MGNEVFSLLLIVGSLAAVIFVFVRISLTVRKKGGTLSTIMYAATYEFYNSEKRKAIHELVQVLPQEQTDEDNTDPSQNDDPQNSSSKIGYEQRNKKL